MSTTQHHHGTRRQGDNDGERSKETLTATTPLVFFRWTLTSPLARNVDLVKTFRSLAVKDVSMQDVVTGVARLMAKEVWHRDHPISEDTVQGLSVCVSRSLMGILTPTILIVRIQNHVIQ